MRSTTRVPCFRKLQRLLLGIIGRKSGAPWQCQHTAAHAHILVLRLLIIMHYNQLFVDKSVLFKVRLRYDFSRCIFHNILLDLSPLWAEHSFQSEPWLPQDRLHVGNSAISYSYSGRQYPRCIHNNIDKLVWQQRVEVLDTICNAIVFWDFVLLSNDFMWVEVVRGHWHITILFTTIFIILSSCTIHTTVNIEKYCF